MVLGLSKELRYLNSKKEESPSELKKGTKRGDRTPVLRIINNFNVSLIFKVAERAG